MKKLAVFAVAALVAAAALADYGWYNGAMSIGGKTTDPTAWSISSDNPTDVGTVTDLTISSIAFNIWDDADNRGGADMYFRIWDGGSSQVGEDQHIWLGAATRIEGSTHDYSISWTGSEDLAAAVGLNLEEGKTYYVDMWAKTYNNGTGETGDEWYSGENSSNYHAKMTYSSAVPEPATMSLLGLGALAMVLRRKLRK